MDAGQATVLLLFKRGTLSGVETSVVIPPHDGEGPVHLAFAIATETLTAWEVHLQERGVGIESIRWRGREHLLP
jgi:hypothetical protein